MSDARGKVFKRILRLGEWAPHFFPVPSATPLPPPCAWLVAGHATDQRVTILLISICLTDSRVTIYLIRDKAMLLLTDRSVIRQRLIPPSSAVSFICFIRVDYVQPDYVQGYVFPYSQCIQSQCWSGFNCLFAAIAEALNHCSMPYCLPYRLMTWSGSFSFFFFMLELMVLFN